MAPSRKLWTNIYHGDKKAYEEVFVYYFNRYCNYGKKFTDDSTIIEDAAQETLMIIWNRKEMLPAIEKQAAYFYTSFRYILFNKIKQQQKIVGEDQITEEPGFLADQIIIKKELEDEIAIRLKAALSKLTDRQREAIFLKFYEGLSYEEVSLIMHISTKATYKIMARALAILKDHFGLSSKLLFFFLCRVG